MSYGKKQEKNRGECKKKKERKRVANSPVDYSRSASVRNVWTFYRERKAESERRRETD